MGRSRLIWFAYVFVAYLCFVRMNSGVYIDIEADGEWDRNVEGELRAWCVRRRVVRGW